jgi:putative glutamine amidotransferase
MQSLNVWRGGSLIQDLTPLPVNHEAGSKVAIAHTALIAPDSLLASLLTPEEAPRSGDFLRLPINTSHHQSIAAPGDGLRIVARCPDDGVIEAVELDPSAQLSAPDAWPSTPPVEPTAPPELFHVEQSASVTTPNLKLFHVEQFLLAVQWHPERSYDISPASRALFARLIEEARTYSLARNEFVTKT